MDPFCEDSLAKYFSYPSISYAPTAPTQSYSFSFLEFLMVPMLVYLLWQILYCFVVLDLNRDKVHDGKHVTSFSWLVTDFLKKKQSSILTQILHYIGEDNYMYFFIFSQFAYTLITILPVYIFYHSFWIHTIFIIFVVMMSVFNGADYYIEVFSRRYRLEIEKLQEKNDKEHEVLMGEDLKTK